MLLFFEHLPLGEDLLVEFQHRAGLGILDAGLVTALEDLIHEHSIDAALLQFRADSNKEEVQSVVDLQVVEDMDPACWEQTATALAEGLGKGRCGDTEANQFILLVLDKDGEIRIQQWDKLIGIADDLLVGKLNCAEEWSIGLVGQLEDAADDRFELGSSLYLMVMELFMTGDKV